MRSTSPRTARGKSPRSVALGDFMFSSRHLGRDINHLEQLMMLKTNIPDHIRRSPTEESISVIHAPESFQDWVGWQAPSVSWALSLSLTLIALDKTDRGAGTTKRKELSQRLKYHRLRERV